MLSNRLHLLPGEFPELVRGIHFGWNEIETPDGKTAFKPCYEMREGKKRSNPIEIARWRGFSEEILKYAEIVRDTMGQDKAVKA